MSKTREARITAGLTLGEAARRARICVTYLKIMVLRTAWLCDYRTSTNVRLMLFSISEGSGTQQSPEVNGKLLGTKLIEKNSTQIPSDTLPW